MRLRQIALVARDLRPVEDSIWETLGLEVCYRDPGLAHFGLRHGLYPIGDHILEVVVPKQPGTTAERFLERRGGDGGYMVIVQSEDLAEDRRRVSELGIRVVWEIEFPDIATIHLHPRDVGGAILSIDVADPPKSWRWAGPKWESRSRSDVTSAVVGVELRSADPAALADRWSGVLGLPVVADAAGVPTLPLDGSTLRFAEGAGTMNADTTVAA